MDATPTQIANVAGPLLVGYFLNWGLYGTLSVQVYTYYLAFPNDRLILKLLVYGVHIIESLQAVLVLHDAYTSFVVGFGNFQVLTGMHFVWLTMPVLSGIVAFCVQIFYALRVANLSKSKVISSFIALLALVQVTGALVSGIAAIKAGSLLRLASRLEFISNGVFAITSGVCDIVVATSMAFYLYRLDSGSVRSTHVIVTRIIRLVVGTGALTAAVAIIDIALFYSFAGKQQAWFFLPVSLLGRLHSNSMMVIFNNRVQIVGGRGQNATAEITLSGTALSYIESSEPSNIVLSGREAWDAHITTSKPKRTINSL